MYGSAVLIIALSSQHEHLRLMAVCVCLFLRWGPREEERCPGALSGRHQSLRDRDSRLHHAQVDVVAERRLRLREALQTEHRAQLQLHGPAARLWEHSARRQAVCVRRTRLHTVCGLYVRRRHEDLLLIAGVLYVVVQERVVVDVVGVDDVIVGGV